MFRNAALMDLISFHVSIQFGTTYKTIPILLGYSVITALLREQKSEKDADRYIWAISKM